MEGEKEKDTYFLLFTHISVVLLAGMQIALCLQPEWGSGFSLSDFKSEQFFNLHPLFSILAFGVAMTESLISFRAFNLKRKTGKTLHALLQLASLLLGVAAFAVVLTFHNSNKYPNFYSVHSWIGMAVYILAWAHFTAGFFIFWLPSVAPSSVKKTFLRYHRLGGLVIYIAAMAAVATGLMQKQSFLRNRKPHASPFCFANLLANAAALIAVFTSLGVLGVLGIGPHESFQSASLEEEETDLSFHLPKKIRGRTPSRPQK